MEILGSIDTYTHPFPQATGAARKQEDDLHILQL
jgi:hypothetical protein